MGIFNYRRRATWPVKVGDVEIGGSNPIRIQSMTSTSTMDTSGSVAQIKRIVAEGADIVRLTAQGVREAENLGEIRRELRKEGITTPLVADIHFNPKAAFAAAGMVEKVRINPGNFVDPGRVFKQIDYTDREYAAELERLEHTVAGFLEICRQNHTAIRLGVNHGSLSDRIMSRYGDTPAGMVESAMEFLRVCRKCDFADVVISIKASNVSVMVETVRLLTKALEAEGMHFPLHLGVTEAGDGEDGRIKSAVGIGTLLADGIGDTIRVSLSEAPEREIPVARRLVDYVATFAEAPEIKGAFRHADTQTRRESLWGAEVTKVVGLDLDAALLADAVTVNAADDLDETIKRIEANPQKPVVASSDSPFYVGSMRALMAEIESRGLQNPVVLKVNYDSTVSPEDVTIRASVDLGALLLDGYADAIWIDSARLTGSESVRLALAILQATRLRISKTEYIACPGCGRTMYDLQDTLRRIKEATSHLKGLKIGVMGCIVNGPGEMADADYGYVGAAAGKVNLYRGKQCVAKNIPTAEAIERLIDLIRENGDWTEPQ